MLFLFFTVTTLSLLLVNMLIFVFSSGQNSDDQGTVTFVAKLMTAFLLIPLTCFLLFHLYLTCVRSTTKELIKRINSKENRTEENLWCDIDGSNIDFFE